ncbi:MAG: cupredoxin domain-containing protein [Gaiella sp.]
MPKATALAVVVASGAIGVSGVFAASTATGLTVKLKEFKVIPAAKVAKAGKVTFVVSNVGKIQHELVVMKTNVAPDELPVNAKGRVREKGVVGEAGNIEPGKTKRLTLTLKAGKYVLLCNLAGHYKAGQYSAFTVK